jgi:hypothetical protein
MKLGRGQMAAMLFHNSKKQVRLFKYKIGVAV